MFTVPVIPNFVKADNGDNSDFANPASGMGGYSTNSASAQSSQMPLNDILKILQEYSDRESQKQMGFNKEMFETAMNYNANQAQLDREFQREMSNTQYQRAVADLEKAGLNKLLAYSHLQGSTPNGSQASISPTSASRGGDVNSFLSSLATSAPNKQNGLLGSFFSLIGTMFGTMSEFIFSLRNKK